MANERLRGAIAGAGLTIEDLADKVGVTAKSVERWITRDRVPHRAHRIETVALLGADEAYLWPSLADDPRAKSAARAELVEFFPSRAAVPMDLWASLPDRSSESFDLLAFAGLFLPEHTDEFVPRVARLAESGVRVRICLGDPDGSAVALRGEEEGTYGGMAQRVRLVLRYFEDVVDIPGCNVRLHNTTLYTSIYRSDNDALVNTHAYGAPAAHNPVMHLRRIPGGRLFDHYIKSFDRVWELARPLRRSDLTGG